MLIKTVKVVFARGQDNEGEIEVRIGRMGMEVHGRLYPGEVKMVNALSVFLEQYMDNMSKEDLYAEASDT